MVATPYEECFLLGHTTENGLRHAVATFQVVEEADLVSGLDTDGWVSLELILSPTQDWRNKRAVVLAKTGRIGMIPRSSVDFQVGRSQTPFNGSLFLCARGEDSGTGSFPMWQNVSDAAVTCRWDDVPVESDTL